MKWPRVLQLSFEDRTAIERHVVRLDGADRRLRFGQSVSDEVAREYVAHINFDDDAGFGVFGGCSQLAGFAHLSRQGAIAELGISVLPEFRGRGVGSALLTRIRLQARHWRVEVLRMQCLTDNTAMMHMARKQGMEIVSSRGESHAWLKMPPAGSGRRFNQRMLVIERPAGHTTPV